MGRPMGGPERVRRSMAGGVQVHFYRRRADAAVRPLMRSQDGEAGISLITRAMAKARMKPPLVETT